MNSSKSKIENRKSKIKWVMAAICLSILKGSKPRAVEIPLDVMTSVRMGYIDLQKVFDTYPEKSFAEGDLLKEIGKRKRELDRRQTEINSLREQIGADQSALRDAEAGRRVIVPRHAVISPSETPPPSTTAKPPSGGQSPLSAHRSSTTVEPYPTTDPYLRTESPDVIRSTAPLPASAVEPTKTPPASSPFLDLLASATAPMLLNAEARTALQKRIADNQHILDRAVSEFKGFRTKALEDMKVLQTQKTYGVMSKIYAILQVLARDESITVVLDKAYILYGEDTVDLTDKLMARLQQQEQILP